MPFTYNSASICTKRQEGEGRRGRKEVIQPSACLAFQSVTFWGRLNARVSLVVRIGLDARGMRLYASFSSAKRKELLN